MSDEKLRFLERAFAESGSPEDELAYLREVVRTGGSLGWESYQRLAELDVDAAAGYLLARVECGDLEREKLELAAYCAHEPARAALKDGAPAPPGQLLAWADGLSRWGPEVLVVADCAMKNYVLPFVRYVNPKDGDDLYARLRQSLAWLRGVPGVVPEGWPGGLPDMRMAVGTASWARLQEASATELRNATQHAVGAWALGNAQFEWLTMRLGDRVPGVRLFGPFLDRIGLGRSRRHGPTL